MASRKDQLNAYTFARKRTVAAFLQPSPGGSEEGAPRPLRAVMPSVVVGALILVGFGAWGIIKPSAPKGWDTPGAYIIVGSESTTRYVVLPDVDSHGKSGPAQLHPVLNFASAKLLVDQGKGDVIKVKESELDNGKIPHGSTIGIPYAPDRLPSATEAGKVKKWAVCERPGAQQGKADKAVFVLGDRDSDKVEGRNRLSGGQTLFVKDGRGTEYLVDPHGTLYPLTADTQTDLRLLSLALFGEGAQPQLVTDDWLGSLNKGSAISFPTLPGWGGPSSVSTLDAAHRKVGMVLMARSNDHTAHQYVVMQDRVEPVSDFTANLLMQAPDAAQLYPHQVPAAQEVALSAVNAGPDAFEASKHWPTQQSDPVNTEGAKGGRRSVACSVYRGDVVDNKPDLSVWASDKYPTDIATGATSAYVTPGTGLFYRQFTGNSPDSGQSYLVTDTGLRYSVPRNNDSDADKPVTGSGTPSDDTSAQQADQARIRLGYGDVKAAPVPANWSGFLPKGPTLDTKSAAQPQGS
jgi:type VII secretion protein EccB